MKPRSSRKTSLTSEYISLIRQVIRADSMGEHHVIIDGLLDEAQSYAKQIKKRGADFLQQSNELIAKAKLDENYLIKL